MEDKKKFNPLGGDWLLGKTRESKEESEEESKEESKVEETSEDNSE